MSKRTIAVGLVSLIVAVALFLVIRPGLLNLFSKNKETTTTDSPFGATKVDDYSISPEDVWESNNEVLKNIPDGKRIFMLGMGFEQFDYSVSWDYTSTPFWATITSLSPSESTARIKFINPSTMPYLDQEKEVKLEGCTVDTSFLTVENPKSIQVQIDFFTQARVGDDLISFCLNQECTTVGRLCKLYRYDI